MIFTLNYLGYYCSGCAQSAIPSELNGGPCTIGHYCPEGTGNPKPCEPGTYNLEEQNFECRACEAGYQCNGMFSSSAITKFE